MPTLILLRELLQWVPGRLDKLSKDTAGSKPTPSGWSPKEELERLLLQTPPPTIINGSLVHNCLCTLFARLSFYVLLTPDNEYYV